MNEIRPVVRPRATTQVADGLPRLAWTMEEFDRLAEYGFFSEDDRIELIGGELVPMSPKGNQHEAVRDELLDFLIRRLPNNVRVSIEIGWRPDKQIYVEPDIVLYPTGFTGNKVPPGEIIVLIEVADTSLSYDTGRKAKIYASLGVREYWVVNAKTLETIVHLEPGAEWYGKVSAFAPSETVAPLALPQLTVSLGAMKIG